MPDRPDRIVEMPMCMDSPPDRAFWQQYHDLAFALLGEVETLTEERDACASDARTNASSVLAAARKRDALAAQVEGLREALIRCAELAGADGEAVAAARSGAMKHPTVAGFVVGAVEQLRRDYDERILE